MNSTLARWLSFCARLIFPHHSVRRVLRGPCKGLRFRVEPGIGATFALGSDAMNFQYLDRRLLPGMTVYDLGANRGQTVLYFSRRVGPQGAVIAFEPASENLRLLKENIALNQIQNTRLFECAVADAPGTAVFVYDETRPTQATLASVHLGPEPRQEGTLVECRTLDELLEEGLPLPDLIKIDVEGAGGAVIAGSQKLISKRRPGIFFEVHAATDTSPELLALARLRDEWGYTIEDLQGQVLHTLAPMWGIPVWCSPPS